MKQIQQQQRCTAAQEFQQSLLQLQDILQVDSTQNQVIKKVDTSSSINDKLSKITDTIDLDDLEDAVADIEQYLAKKQKLRTNQL
jgi:hypothetical protein